ncbi:MAG: 3'(2'),5'-bisphosphate nucleotidase CysQ [Rikenellaceae bacterium]
MVENQHRELLITHAVNAAIKAGAAIMDIYNTPESFDISLKSDNTPITAADRAAHDSIKVSLGATRIPILSEEGREMRFYERRNWDLFWMVDPLDGTVEFIERNNEFTVNIALMENRECVLGVIYIPYLQRLYIAERGGGAHIYRNISPNPNSQLSYSEIMISMEGIHSDNQDHRAPTVAISRSHNTPETFAHIDKLRVTHPDLVVVEQGSSYKFCMLAEGVVDYYIRTTHTSEWDTAAGEIILSEAGGSTRSLDGEKLTYNKEDLHNPHFECWRDKSPLTPSGNLK